jgi:hypothetical protein
VLLGFLSEGDGGQFLAAKEDRKVSIYWGRSDGNRLVSERLSEAEDVVSGRDGATVINLSDDVCVFIEHGR